MSRNKVDGCWEVDIYYSVASSFILYLRGWCTFYYLVQRIYHSWTCMISQISKSSGCMLLFWSYCFRCNCGNWQIMDRNEECKCCLEISQIVDKNNEVTEPPPCITQHPGFGVVCLNRWVLQTAWYQYKQQYGNRYEGPEHKLNRHIAYRQLVRWCWGF